MQLSVVILNYNVRHFLELCLLSVEKAISGLDAEVIVVDNHSPDDSCLMVRAKFPWVKLVENQENSGFPKGNNIGVALATGTYLCILNPDTVVAEDTFSKALAFFDSKPQPGIVGCKLIDGSGNFLPESKRGIPTPWVAFSKVAGLHRLSSRRFGKYYASHLSPDESGEVDVLVGAFMLMKREVYLEAGGFDENCFMYSDDIDLSYTVLKSGRKNYYFSGTSVLHFKGESTVKDGLYMQRFREAMNFFYQKHFRVSPAFDLAMKMGAWWFSRRKKNASARRVKPGSYAIVSENPEIVNKAINLLGKKAVTQISLASKILPSSKGHAVQYWFDTDGLNFKQALCLMEASPQETTFRFVIGNKVIGSDSSIDRGEILTI